MKNTLKKLICEMLAALLLLSLTACGEKEWTRSGYFSDENGNMLSVTYMELDEESGWYVGVMLGDDLMEDSFGGMVEQDGNTLRGSLPSGSENEPLTIVLSEEGEEGLELAVIGVGYYHFLPMDIPEASIFVTINVEGMGSIEYAEGEAAPEHDPEYPFQSAQINLAEPTVHTFGAYPDAGYKFVKWTKNGEDFSTEPIMTLTLDETADFIAVFEEDPEAAQKLVSALAGEYQCDRAHATVEALGGKEVKVTVDWGNSAWSLARWVMNGELDTGSMIVFYSDSVNSELTYNDDGELESENVIYTDGVGMIEFRSDGTFVWRDNQSDYDELVFTPVTP